VLRFIGLDLVERAGAIQMGDYNGYLIKQDPDSKKWEVFWKEKRVAGDFAREADAEEYLDDLLPSNRTS
jgi:hypothetical protein